MLKTNIKYNAEQKFDILYADSYLLLVIVSNFIISNTMEYH